MSSRSRLISIGDYNASQEVRLSAYADIIVYEQESPSKNMLRAIRFGGYLEAVPDCLSSHICGNLQRACNRGIF